MKIEIQNQHYLQGTFKSGAEKNDGITIDELAEKIFQYVRVCDTRNLKRTITRHGPLAMTAANTPLRIGWSAVTSAGDFGFVDVLNVFKANHIAVDQLDGNGWSAIHAAVRRGHSEVIEMFVQGDFDIDICSQSGWTPFHVAVMKGTNLVIQQLVKAKVDINKAGPGGWSSLHLAAHLGRRDLIELLLKENASVKVVNGNGATPLYIAAQNGNHTAVKSFMDGGVSCTHPKNDMWAPLHIAAANGHVKVIELLNNNDHFDVNVVNNEGCTGLYLAVQNDKPDVVTYLMERKADPEILSRYLLKSY